MENISAYLKTIFSNNIYKMVLSKPRNKSNNLKKVEIIPVKDKFQIIRYEGNQVFHQNVSSIEAIEICTCYLENQFLQLNAWDAASEYSLMVSKKGKVSYIKNACLKNTFSRNAFSKNADSKNVNSENADSRNAAPKNANPGNTDKSACEPPEFAHDRKKNYLLEEGTVIQPLIDMGIFTLTGQVVKSKFDKFKQINRFLEMIDDVVKESRRPLNMIDFGCGKSYLTFIIYFYFTYIRNINVNIVGLDLKAEVIKKCNESAERYGYEKLKFEIGDINGYQPKTKIDIVISLHACDVATDYALYNAVKWNAGYIFAVPCCQHELNHQMKSASLAILTRYGIVKERMAALMTDAIRANLLEHHGYRTQLLEFVDFDHTPKNILIRAVNTGRKVADDSPALQEALMLTREFHFQPTLLKLMHQPVSPEDFPKR